MCRDCAPLTSEERAELRELKAAYRNAWDRRELRNYRRWLYALEQQQQQQQQQQQPEAAE